MRHNLRRTVVLLPTILLPVLVCALLLLAPSAVAGSVAVTPLPPVEETDAQSGTCYSFYPDPDTGAGRPFLPPAYAAGSRWDRFDFTWPAIEPANDSWQFSAHDTLVDDLQSAGVEHIVGILLWTPDWAATEGSFRGLEGSPAPEQRPPGWYAPEPGALVGAKAVSAASSPPQGLYLDWDDSDNHWGDYVYHVVSQFGDRVKHWEMWNEPEWSFFWTGSSAEYAQLLKVGYQATKAACPDCTVLFGGLHYWANTSYYRWVLNTLHTDPDAAQENHFFDVMSVHLYSRSSSIYDEVTNIRAGMADFGVDDHPIWLTETGVPVWDDSTADPDPTKYDYAATQQEAGAYVIQSYANAWAADVERYFFFRTHDADMGEFFGLIRNDYSLRPAYVAYQVARTYLISPTMVTGWRYSTGPRRVTLWGTPHGKVSVLWNREPTAKTFGYPATLSQATLVDRWGVTQTLTATAGTYTVTLPGATANRVEDPSDYFIGGEPYLVIEADTIAPTATVAATMTTDCPAHIRVSWAGADDAAGIWRYDVQVQEQGAGDWQAWKSFTAQVEGLYEGESGESYCFRARAWDLAGNVGPWSTAACVTLEQFRQVALRIDAVVGEGEELVRSTVGVTLTDVSMRLVDGALSDVITPTVGGSWSFTSTLFCGDYTLIITPADWWTPPPGWLPLYEPVAVVPGVGTQAFDFEVVTLKAHRASWWLPLMMRSGN